MGEKSVQKKKFILETAHKVFVEKGFRNVTMKDVVDACEISRGGLYLYFSSTEEIFLELIRMESQETDDVFAGSISADASAAEILAVFLKEQKREILRAKKTLSVATYEYFFANNVSRKDNFLKKQFDEAVILLEKLINTGIENGEFYEVDARIAAKNIMYVLEGLKIASLTMGVSGETIDKELLILVQGLVIEE
ncbi:MAG: TetR/AcrR family transcriptional regulator [Lachnospiraceae bacterium]